MDQRPGRDEPDAQDEPDASAALRRLGRGWRSWLDVALGVGLGALAGLAGLTSSEYPNPGPVTAVLMLLAGLMLVLRRSRPTVSFVGAMGLMGLVSLLFGSYQAGTALLIAIVACYSALVWGVPLGVFVAVVGLYALGESWREPMPDALGGAAFILVLLGLAGAGGHLARRLRELTAANIALRELVQREATATPDEACPARPGPGRAVRPSAGLGRLSLGTRPPAGVVTSTSRGPAGMLCSAVPRAR